MEAKQDCLDKGDGCGDSLPASAVYIVVHGMSIEYENSAKLELLTS